MRPFLLDADVVLTGTANKKRARDQSLNKTHGTVNMNGREGEHKSTWADCDTEEFIDIVKTEWNYYQF